MKKLKLGFLGMIVFWMIFFVFSRDVYADSIGQIKTFFVNSKYDQFLRTKLEATLRHVSSRAYFYVDDRYWDNLSTNQRNFLSSNISFLGQEFDKEIYPKETTFWGTEPNPGVDNDPMVTILLEDLITGNGGYFDTSNQYPKNKVADSNEREIVFVSVESVGGSFTKIFLGHEFQHLISFNQKELLRNSSEDVWLNELRSEYSVSLLGYNNRFDGSSLESRVDSFLDDPSDSLTEWPNVSSDYSQVALFAEYLVEQYGSVILSETLQDSEGGIVSIDKYLQNHGFSEMFSDVFESWTVANYLNNRSLDKKYGYQRDELKNIKVTPIKNTLFYPSESSFVYNLKPWQSAWYQYNILTLPSDKALKIDYSPSHSVKVLYSDNLGRVGVLTNSGYIVNPGNLNYVVLMPINETKTSDFGSNDESTMISLKISYANNEFAQKPKDGTLVKRHGSEQEMYVIEGNYKRYLRPDVIKLYGHLDVNKVLELDDVVFNSYTTANYIRPVDEKRVYAVWPDGTKHWLNITPQQWDASGRDWNAIFVINELESNSYKTEADITH